MPMIVRKVTVKNWVSEEFDWLEPGAIEADAVTDLKTTQNKLSIFFVEDEDEAKLAVAMVAVTAKETKHFGYALIPLEVWQALNLETEEENATTPHALVNSWHRNVIKLSSDRLVALAKAIKKHTPIYFYPDVLAEVLSRSISDNSIQLNQVQDPKIKKKIEQLLS